jgi:hypothetical protein
MENVMLRFSAQNLPIHVIHGTSLWVVNLGHTRLLIEHRYRDGDATSYDASVS